MSTAIEPTSEMLTLERIRTWAASKAPDAVVGRSRRAGCCPVARYLHAAGVVRPRVGGYIHWDTYNRAVAPSWVAFLVTAVDRDRPKGTPITAADLLAIIDDLEQRP